MKIAIFLTFVCLAAALPNARQVGNLNNPDRLPGEFLVVLRAPEGKNANFIYSTKVSSKIAAISDKISIVDMFTNLMSPILHVKTTDESVMSQLFQLDEVESIDSNLFQQMIEQCSTQNTGTTLWGLSRISTRAGPGSTYSYNSNDGSGATVYVLDTGIRVTHNDFGSRAVWGNNFVNDGDDRDQNGHGTHCAGTVGGTTYGVAKGTTVVAVKVLNNFGSGSTTGIVNGINWMVGQPGVKVGSMSLGGGANSALDSAVNSAVSAGTPVVVAAGNSNANACNFSPARAASAICVGATDSGDNLSSFSNWGTCVDILAPGSSILSAWYTSDTATNTISGTSMACPHVAGWVATYRSANPGASPALVLSALTSAASQGFINMRGMSGPNLLQYSSCA